MQDRYWLPPRKALICRIAGAIFLLSALAMAVVVAVAGITPGASPYCGTGDGCVWEAQPTILLSEEDRVEVGASVAAHRRFEAYVARPEVRLGLAAVDAIDTVPFALVLVGVGCALRRLGGRGVDALARALRWLKVASAAAIAWALAQPVYETLLETLLSPGTPAGAHLQVTIYLGNVATALLLAMAAYAAIGAVEAGLRAQRDLDDFV